MECKHCGHQWIAVYPKGTGGLVCPECGKFTVLPPHETRGEWNVLFWDHIEQEDDHISRVLADDIVVHAEETTDV